MIVLRNSGNYRLQRPSALWAPERKKLSPEQRQSQAEQAATKWQIRIQELRNAGEREPSANIGTRTHPRPQLGTTCNPTRITLSAQVKSEQVGAPGAAPSSGTVLPIVLLDSAKPVWLP